MLLFLLLSVVSSVLGCSCCSPSRVFATGDDGRDCCKGDVLPSASSLNDIDDDVLIFLLLTNINRNR